MRKKSVLLGFAASGGIVLGAFAATLPANAASLPSSTASTQGSASAGSLSPDSVGSIVCGGDVCIQRITSVVNGKATIDAWANTATFTGVFYLGCGPVGDALNLSSPTQQWIAGGAGHDFAGAYGDCTVTEWKSSGVEIGNVSFAV